MTKQKGEVGSRKRLNKLEMFWKFSAENSMAAQLILIQTH